MYTNEWLTNGVFPAIVTPFDADEQIDHEALAAEAQRLEAAGVDGLVPVGSTGESATLTHDEHVEVVETVIDAIDNVPVIAGTGSNNTAEALELSHQAADAGADALLLIAPYYNNPEPAGFKTHYERVADAVDCPQILYNVPSRTGRNMDPDVTVELAQHERIIAYKAASGDLGQISEIIERTQDAEFAVMSGDDALTLPIISLGGTGAISVAANVVPELVSHQVAAALSDDFETARELQYELGPLYRGLFVETNPIPVKEALAMQGYCQPYLRSPLTRLSAEHRPRLREILQALHGVTVEAEPV